MKRCRFLFDIGLIFYFLLLTLNTIADAGELKYDRKKAEAYAEKWCMEINLGQFKEFSGKDCANFASQNVIAGFGGFDNDGNIVGNPFGCVKGAPITGKDGKTRTITMAREVGPALTNSFCFKTVSLSEAKEGDIITWQDSGKVSKENPTGTYHSGILNNEGYVAYHSSNRCFGEKRTPSWVGKNFTIYQFQDKDKCKTCEREEKTCKANLKDKCTGCLYCEESTGECKEYCADKGVGRCASRYKCIEMGYVWLTTWMCNNMGPSGDCPDDTLTVGASIPVSNEVTHPSTTSSIGILDNGYSYDILKVLSTYGQEGRIISINDLDPSLVLEMPLLIIPTGGLMGLSDSEILRTGIYEYVKQGGTLLVLSQQHGYEFSALPVPREADGTYNKVGGYGWLEDQSCQINSSYIDSWHQVLAGQTRSTPSVNIDGYFTSFPENTQIILRRTSNGQPALITYPFEQGRVIATTAYIEYAYTSNQASTDDVALLRDIISWAVKPATLPEIRPGEAVNINLDITNYDNIETATAAEVELYGPNTKEVKYQEKIPVNLAPGQSTELPLSFISSTTDPLGIYHVKYRLLTEGYQLLTSEMEPEGVNVWLEYLLQPSIEEPSGRFVVSNPPKTHAQTNQINFSIQSDAERYKEGDAVNLTVLAFNNSDTERTITAKFGEQSQIMVVPANGSSSFVYPKTATCDYDHYGQWWGFERVYFYEGTKGLDVVMKGYRVYPLSANISIQTDKAIYAKGETVTITSSLKNNIAFSWEPTVQIYVLDFKGIRVFEDSKTLTLAPNGTGSLSTSFILPPTLSTGSYQVYAEGTFGSRTSVWAHTGFELPQAQISVTPNLFPYFITGTNTIPFNITNIGKINVYSGTIDLSLKESSGGIVYSGSQPFSIAVGESKTLDVPITIPSLKLGQYVLTYSQSDETRRGSPTIETLLNSYTLNSFLDKPIYKIGETANLNVIITNIGKFVQEASLTIDVPFLGFTETKPITVNPSETTNIPFTILLPSTLKEGGPGQITLSFPSGEHIERDFYLEIMPVKINQEILFDKPSYRIRENLGINYTITNDGNFASPLNVGFNLSIPDLAYTYEGSLTLEPGNSIEVPFEIPIPETLLQGWHNMNITLTPPWGTSITKETGFVVPESSLILGSLGTTTPRVGDTINLTIENTGGVDTTYSTEKLSINDRQELEIYHGNVTGTILSGEKNTLVDIQIPPQAVNGPTYLHIRMKDSKTGKTVYYDKSIEITGLTASLQTMTDKNAYLSTETITGISSILDGEFPIERGTLKVSVSKLKQAEGFTHFLPKKGWWPFYAPSGVAIGSDGFVYVADTYGSRIQKFDSNGNFIMKWGEYCSVDSDWDGIPDQSCEAGTFNEPWGIAIGLDGSVYVSDASNHRIQKFDSTGNFIRMWGSYGSGDGQFNSPKGIAVGPDGSVYVADTGNNCIQKFDSNGGFIAKWWGFIEVGFKAPSGIAVGTDGSVYVANTRRHRIEKFDSDGNFIKDWGGFCVTDSDWDGVPDKPCEGEFYYPQGIAVDSDGYVYVADTENNRIQKFNSNGDFIEKWENSIAGDWGFSWPEGIGIGPDGSVFIADTWSNRIQKFDSNGNFIMKWGMTGGGDGEFSEPKGIAIDSDNSIYVTNWYRIQKFDISKNFITKWGSYCQTDPNGDGVPENSCGGGEFAMATGIAVGPDGSVYVADTDNHRIQKFDSNGNFVTKWGEPSGEGTEGIGFNYPWGVAVGLDGSVYVADTGNDRIQKFDSNGNFITEWGEPGSEDGQFNNPEGIAIGSDGSVYIADTWNNRIQKFDSNGNFIKKWGSEGSEDGQFAYPVGIAIGSDGSVYVADTDNQRIQKFDSSGNFIDKWESTYNTDNSDGEFGELVGIAVSSDGSVFVVDSYMSRIQKMVAGSVNETLFETTLPIDQLAGALQDYTTDIGTLNATGKLYLNAKLLNSLSQTVAQANYPFYIVEGNTVLLFNTDKKVYRPGETVTITGRVENRASIGATNLTFTLYSKLNTQSPELLLTQTFDIPAEGTQSFTITTPAGAGGTVTLTGNVSQENSTLIEITDQYEVTRPNVSVVITTPNVIGNEPFNINVEITNTGKIEATLQMGVQSSEFEDSQTITIPEGETKLLQYSQQISEDMIYTFTFTGDLEQTIQKQILFGEKAEVQLALQPLYQEGDIIIPYYLGNTGVLEAAFPVTFALFKDDVEISETTKAFTLPASESVSGSLSYNLSEGLYILRYEITGFQTESQVQVAKAAQGEIMMEVNDYYPEGTIVLPYTVNNTGPFDAEFEIEFALGTSSVSETTFIPAGGNYSGDLRYNLPLGDYTIRATLTSQPSSTYSESFRVIEETKAEMVVSLGTQTNGLIPVNVNLTNLGYNTIEGSLRLSAIPSTGSGQAVWNGEEPISQLLPQNSQLITINVNPSGFSPGNYNLQVELLNNSNQLIAVRSLEFGVQSAIFQITQLPSYRIFYPGQEAIFVFRVKNTGNQEGSFDLNLKSYDLINLTQREWLKPNEEKTLTYGFMLPEDLEEKDYIASYELKDSRGQGFEGSSGQVKYHLAGISLNVNASLDKPYYNEGETAHLTINIQSNNPNPQNLFARVNYAGYEPQQPFTLNGSQTLSFDVPLPSITGEKLFYGIYYESGRSIHLNSLYIHKTGDVLTIETDKQVYNPGENVFVTVTGSVSGNMTLSGPGGYAETFLFSGLEIKSFALPAIISAGTYFINVQLTIPSTGSGQAPNSELITVVHPFDVAGIQVKVLECQNDKGKYASTDTITTNFTIFSNTTIPAILKAWIVNPKGQYASTGEQNTNLSSLENALVTHYSPLITEVSGIHRLVYGIYGSENLLLCSGSEAFDVGDAVLLGISTDKKDYPTNTEPVIVTTSLFGSVDADLQIELDETLVKIESVSVNGYTTYTTELQNIIPGPHTLKATLTAGGLTSTKETSFTYALAYMPKPQISASPFYLDFSSINLGSTSAQTITLSSTGNVDLVIGTIILSGTDQGEFSILSDNCSGGTITPSGTCTLEILFSPTSLGAKSASLSIPSNATEMPTLYLPLSGTGVTTLNIAINPDGSGRVTGTGIDCPGDCTESFPTEGASIELTAVPMECYQFTNWTGDINLAENPVTVNMDTHKNVTANFAINTFTITATASSGGNISPSSAVTVNCGESRTFSILPSECYYVADVKVDGESVGAVLTYTFDNVTSDHTIEALFAINQYTITTTAGSNGIIIPTGSLTINYGADQSFIITPDTGYHVLDVKVDGASVGPVTSYIFSNIISNHTIEVTFEVDNTPPVANAGPDQNVITGQVVTLDGSESFDPEGAMITFLWTFVEVPAGSSVTDGSLSDVTSAKPEFIPDVNGIYRLQLIVNDGALNSGPDEVVITGTTPNVAPNANAGPDQNVFTGTIVQLDGNRSTDPDHGPEPLSYLWSFILKPAGSLLTDNDIVNRDIPNASFIPDVEGTYELKLTVSDGDLSSEDTLLIMATPPNVPPNANAGADMTINLGDVAVLNGSTSNDPDNGPQSLTYLWRFVAVPAGSQLTNGHISGADTVSPSFTPDVLGTYVLELMVFDGSDVGFDNVAVSVINLPPNPAPAGGGVCEINSQFPLEGQISDYNGDIVDYEWSEGNTLLFEGSIQTIFGGAPVNLPEHSYQCAMVGEHTITLSASDGINQPAVASININVIDTTAPTLSPVPDKNILWPPNHKMVNVTIQTNARDNSGGPVTLSAVVSSNEPQDGLGDGDTSPDWTEPVIDQVNGIITLQLRAERSGSGKGRIYTIMITGRDTSGNTSQAKVEIIVPHDKGKK
jgi:streptogramin lyase